MSLISSASPYSNENTHTRKRISTMKRGSGSTAKIKPFTILEEIDNSPVQENMQDIQERNENNSQRIKNLLDNLSANNDGDKLANYEPIIRPSNTVTKSDVVENTMNPDELIPQTIEREQNSDFSYSNSYNGDLANYNTTYQPPPSLNQNQPYYSKMGIGNDNSKLSEKMNHIIHMLEEMQNEKTQNVTEEFILYTFLGIFIIFVVDKFSGNRKYSR
jgi:hypothetical protein